MFNFEHKSPKYFLYPSQWQDGISINLHLPSIHAWCLIYNPLSNFSPNDELILPYLPYFTLFYLILHIFNDYTENGHWSQNHLFMIYKVDDIWLQVYRLSHVIIYLNLSSIKSGKITNLEFSSGTGILYALHLIKETGHFSNSVDRFSTAQEFE